MCLAGYRGFFLFPRSPVGFTMGVGVMSATGTVTCTITDMLAEFESLSVRINAALAVPPGEYDSDGTRALLRERDLVAYRVTGWAIATQELAPASFTDQTLEK